MQDTYVTGGLAGLLQTYLDQQKIYDPGLSLALTKFSADSRMPTSVWRELLEKIESIQPQPAMGLKIGRLSRPHHFGVLGYLIMHCSTLGEALARFQQYQVLVHNVSKVHVQIKDAKVIMSWDTEQGASTQLSDEVFLSCFITFIQHITQDQRVTPIALHFMHPAQGEASAYEKVMGFPVSFGHDRVTLEMSTDAINIPINTSDPHLLSLMASKADALKGQDDFLTHLQQLLSDSLSQGVPTLENSARQLKISPRTLHRRLQQRQLNFKQFLRQTRELLAKLYLDDPALSLNEISFLLGYSEQSAFARAFKLWLGITPTAYRKIKKSK